MNGFLIKTDGFISTFEIPPVDNSSDKTLDTTLEFYQSLVGGMIEIAKPAGQCKIGDQFLIWDDWIMLVNEDGLSLNLPLNELASAFVGYHVLGNVAIIPSGALE